MKNTEELQKQIEETRRTLHNLEEKKREIDSENYIEETNMKLSDVLFPEDESTGAWLSFDSFQRRASIREQRFFAWNGRIYHKLCGKQTPARIKELTKKYS